MRWQLLAWHVLLGYTLDVKADHQKRRPLGDTLLARWERPRISFAEALSESMSTESTVQAALTLSRLDLAVKGKGGGDEAKKDGDIQTPAAGDQPAEGKSEEEKSLERQETLKHAEMVDQQKQKVDEVKAKLTANAEAIA